MIYIAAGFDFFCLRFKHKYCNEFQKTHFSELKNIDTFIYVDILPNNRMNQFGTLENFFIFLDIHIRESHFFIKSKKIFKRQNKIIYTLSFLNKFPLIKLVYLYNTYFRNIPETYKKNCNVLYVKGLPFKYKEKDVTKVFPKVKKIITTSMRFKSNKKYTVVRL